MPHQHSGKKEKSAWQAWQAYEEGTETFQYSADHPFEHLNAEFRNTKRLIVILYDNSSPVSSVNETRIKGTVNCHKNQSMDGIPLTHDQNALLQHTQ